MRVLRALLVVFDLVQLVNLVTGPGPVFDNLRMLAVAFLFLAGLVILFALVVLAVALVDQRQSPYPG